MSAPKPSPSKSPQFIKPMDLFLMRKKRKMNGLSSNGSRKKFIISPLKCIDINSPIKNELTPPRKVEEKTGRKTPRKGTPSKLVTTKTPNKTPKKTPRKTPLKERLIKSENALPNVKKSTKSPRRRIAKRQLNFSPAKTRLSVTPLIDENANIEAPIVSQLNQDGPGSMHLPIDWALKTRVRFISTKPFPYRGYFSATESATGTTSFVRSLSSVVVKGDKPASFKVSTFYSSDSSSSIDSSIASVLKKNCFVWRHPHLPGFELYPRMHNRCKVAPITHPMSEDLLNEYCSSLKDLYDLLKARQCAYFYVCAHSFTVLFRAAGVGGIDEIHAIINPTPEGLKKKLKEEGIEFRMPLLEKEIRIEKQKEKEALEKDQAVVEEMKETDILTSALDEDEDASNFLESLGIDPSESLSQKPKRALINQNKKVYKSSLVVVKGSHTQELIPFLSNSRIILSKTGSLAYVPPTLLAPVAFEGAHLHFLKPKLNSFKDEGNQTFNLELKGPILPNMVQNLCELFKTILGDYKVHLVHYENSGPFSEIHSVLDKEENLTKSIFAKENLKDCGLPINLIENICIGERQSTISPSRIVYETGKFIVNL